MDQATRVKPRLTPGMPVSEFSSYYWLMSDLVAFARRLGLPTGGRKPELQARIERHLGGQSDRPKQKKAGKGPRDSEKPLTRATPVVNYKSDDATRAFFRREIGPHFHFTYHLNQFRLARQNLTYGDLVDEWQAEHARRQKPGYRAPIARHGEYNRHIRDFFADPKNEGRTFADAVASWNATKNRRRSPKPRATRKEKP
jgi:hypothetical protein